VCSFREGPAWVVAVEANARGFCVRRLSSSPPEEIAIR
jgi:hypothetical protein